MVFLDSRSKIVIFVAQCILNQNSKIDGCAHYPGVIRETADALVAESIGLIQMPCPELFCLGLDRGADDNADRTIGSEDTRVANLMKEEPAQNRCRMMADDIVYQVEEYLKHGFVVAGIIGINGSPTCGVESTWSDDRECQGRGIFIEIIEEKLRKRRISIPITGIKALEPDQALATIRKMTSGIAAASK